MSVVVSVRLAESAVGRDAVCDVIVECRHEKEEFAMSRNRMAIAALVKKLDAYWNDVYVRPYVRCGPFIVGVVVGYLLNYLTQDRKGNRVEIPKLQHTFEAIFVSYLLAFFFALGFEKPFTVFDEMLMPVKSRTSARKKSIELKASNGETEPLKT
ncbi:hypothetical protein Aduo_005750 [Ancylostoma duodenale]